MPLAVVSVNGLPISILNGEPYAVNLPIVYFPDDGQKTKLCTNRFIHTPVKKENKCPWNTNTVIPTVHTHTDQKVQQVFLGY